MAATTPHTASKDSDPADVVNAVQRYLGELPLKDGLQDVIDEGQQIAAIVAPLGLPRELLAAVHLYPLCRDNFLSINTIKNKFLDDISRFVLGLEDLNHFSLPQHWQPGEALAMQQSEALRKMLLAVVSDVRLVLVRIAEQLYRLRSAKRAAPETQASLALEAREIYAALASRLGVWQLKWELEDLAFRYLDPPTYARIAQQLQEKRTQREKFLQGVQDVLKRELAREGITAAVSGRPKHIYSIYRKMQRKDRGIESLFDIRAVRILVDDVGACYAALGVVHNLWSYIPGEFDDYIANPKDNNYQSLHTAVIG
ncbi:MAG: bifunctional (p)ppGpp synthetase/guanosine-3',5'-bis(diphosphate) 3'-pyrophosphohydrolase, partial [Woeseiaceae bacterium]|nr:bifunctional (p)ppGpp synthetase/guanosine-3',5'-bis(diphosphate) 3'-pyrophosphohydrolase [Woeseiaceae bacterium]